MTEATNVEVRWTFAEAYGRLRAAQKDPRNVSPYLRYLNRPLGRVAAAAAARFGLSPNAVTLLSATASFAGLSLIALWPASPPVAVSCVLALATGYALDSADGQLARLTGRGGPAGEWLDHVVDLVRHLVFHAAVGVALYRFTELPAACLVVPLVFAVVSATRFFALILAEQLRRRRPSGAGTGGRIGPLIQLPAETGVVNLTILLLPAERAFVGVYLAFLVANTVLLAMSLRRRYRELS